MSKELNDLHPYVKYLANKFLDECSNQNLNVVIYFTFRTIDQQNQLYAQGRTKPGRIVTNAKGGQSYHNYRLAFDAAPLVNGKIDWNNDSLFYKMGKIGESVGLEWGGSWKSFKDTPHFQWTGGLSINDLLKDKTPSSPPNFNADKKEYTRKPLPQIPQSLTSLGFSDVKQFQQVMGLVADGIIGNKTNAAISKVLAKPTLKKGASGFAVRYIQYKVGTSITGVFDDQTISLIKKWQSNKKLSSDGIVGNLTWNSFF